MEQEPSPQNNQPEQQEGLQLQPRVWVGSKSDLDNGSLHGCWIDAHRDPDLIYDDIEAMLAESPTPGANTWAIYDQDDFAGIRMDEEDSVHRISTIAGWIVDEGPAFAIWAQRRDEELCDREAFEEAFVGHYDSFAEFAQRVMGPAWAHIEGIKSGLGRLGEFLELNLEKLAADLQESGLVTYAPDPGGGCWVFDGRI